uniref:Uncharacterized protein n=1 Tax=Rhizophora mucronata TaxID=61149 RepID=A0A2P2L0E5_RHIMU
MLHVWWSSSNSRSALQYRRLTVIFQDACKRFKLFVGIKLHLTIMYYWQFKLRAWWLGFVCVCIC